MKWITIELKQTPPSSSPLHRQGGMMRIEMLACLGTYGFPSLLPSLMMSDGNHGNRRVLRTTSEFDVNKRMTIRTTWLACRRE